MTAVFQDPMFYDEDKAREALEAVRWPDGPICPHCGNSDQEKLAKIEGQKQSHRPGLYYCNECKGQFTVTVGTVFERSKVPLTKWWMAAHLMNSGKNGVSAHEIHRSIGVTYKTAWFMMHRIRTAVQESSFVKLPNSGAPVEVDETFIGGKARNMHLDKRERRITGTGGKDKTIVFGALERGGKVHTIIVKDRKKAGLQACVKEHVKAGAVLYSDALASYDGLAQEYAHKVIDHAEKYVDGQIHTQGLDNFWSLLKRGLNGTYVSVEPFHLFRYLDEQMFRYNYRGNREHKISDADRFNMVLSQVAGKRLTYQQVTGKVGETSF